MCCSYDTSSLACSLYLFIQCLNDGFLSSYNCSPPYSTTLKSHFAKGYFSLHCAKLISPTKNCLYGPSFQPFQLLALMEDLYGMCLLLEAFKHLNFQLLDVSPAAVN